MKHGRKSKWKTFWIVMGVVLGILVVGGGGYTYYVYHSITSTAKQVYKPLKQIGSTEFQHVHDQIVQAMKVK